MAPAAADGASVAVADSSLGPILVDGNGMTLYMFVPDAQGPSTCEGGCLEAWPAIPGPATAGDGVDAAKLGVAARSDGSEQATCDGWPLYTFAQDSAPGDVNGQDSGDKWYVLDATCTPIGMEGAATATTAAAAPSATSGETVALADSSLGPILVNGAGMTLYAFAPDAQGPSTCEGGCLEAWPMVHAARDGRRRRRRGPARCVAAARGRHAPGDVQRLAALHVRAGRRARRRDRPGLGDKWYVLDATCTPVDMA